MTDPMYNGDFFIDPGITVKQEPAFPLDAGTLVPSASMPIPARRGGDISHLREFGLELEVAGSPSLQDSAMQTGPELYAQHGGGGGGGATVWSNRLCGMDGEPTKSEPFKMDDDDIFQVDKADLIQGPTLAELNANDDTLLGDLNFDDLLLPEEKSYYINVSANPSHIKFSTPMHQLTTSNNNNTAGLANNNNNNSSSVFGSSCPQSFLGFYKDSLDLPPSIPSSPFDAFHAKAAFSPASQHSSSSSLLQQPAASPPATTTAPAGASTLQQKHSTLHELLLKKEAYSASPERSLLGQSVPSPGSPMAGTSGIGPHRTRTHSSRLSSSAPTHLGLEQIWQRREPRKHLLSTSSLAEAGSTSSLSTGGVLSPEAHDFSHDEGFDSEEDSEHYEDFSSDNDSDDDDAPHSRSMSKKERYFWQYNVQAKGPKGQRLVLKTKQEDPHVLNEITDPVFSPNCAVRGIKHSGKARKGDGNDLTPNPRKLFNIGRELEKLGRIINDMTPVSELPFNVRPKTRKEKNKLASRACRLKKKAQHEANKLKLFGLEHEHKRLISGIVQLKHIIAAKFGEQGSDNQDELSKRADKVVKSATKVKIAGHSTEYVNKVLDKVKTGVPGGGLDDLQL